MTIVRDAEIRETLVRYLRKGHADPVENRIWSEFAVCLGASRVDVCLINGNLSGFEIKSPRDNLDRLPSQVDNYSRVLDFACIVSTEKHAARIRDRVPDWWGVVSVEDGGEPQLVWEREPIRNPTVDALSVAQLLWRDEAYDILLERGLATGLKKATRWALWDRLVESMVLTELSDIVRTQLKTRPQREADGVLMPNGVK